MNSSSEFYHEDIDAMLQDVSNQMARSQLFRRLSANSKTSSPGSKRASARVVKAQSSSASPHAVQRRRTTAAHTTRNKLQSTYPSTTPQQLPQGANAIRHTVRKPGQLSAARPVTWHPGSFGLVDCPEEIPYDGFSTLHPYTAAHPAEVINRCNYLPQSALEPTQPVLQNPAPDYLAQLQSSGYQACYGNGNSLYQPASHDYDSQPSYNYPTNWYQDGQLFPGIQTTNQSQFPTDCPSYSVQQTPTFSSQHCSFDNPSYLQPTVPTQITKQRSKELVGMGLYDGPGRKELSTINSSPHHIDQLFTISQGKGLKLEETWQPPAEDGDELEEESSEEDEAEDVPVPLPTQRGLESTFVPPYGDLSNQTFFFDDDDQCSNFMPFDQGFQNCRSKEQDYSLQNFMWF